MNTSANKHLSSPFRDGASVSAVIPTLNEETNLPYLLPTIGWCSEIIIVDQGSTDQTVEIATNSGVRVVQVQPQPIFDACRAIGVEHAQGDWILTLDADEMIPVTLASRLLELASDDGIDIVAIPRLNYLLGPFRAGGFWPDIQYRFFRRGAVRLLPELHSTYNLQSERVAKLPCEDSFAIHHFSYRGASGLVGKLDQYTDLEILKEPPNSSMFRQLLGAPLRTFFSRYLRHGACREGVRGFWLSAYWAIYALVTAVKRWEQGTLAEALEAEEEARQGVLTDWSAPR